MGMLNSCGHALSQGDGSDSNPGCNWEATPPGYSATAIPERTTRLWQSRWGPRGFGVLLLPCDLGSRRDLAGKKRGERPLAGRP